MSNRHCRVNIHGMKKIVAGEFSEAYLPLMDGVGQVVKNYERILRDEYGYDVRVVTTYNSKTGNPEPSDSHVIRFPMHVMKRLGAYGITVMKQDIKKKVMDIDYDIIHTHSPFSIGALGRRIAKKKHIPHVTTFHSQFRTDVLDFTHSNLLADIVTKYLVHHYNEADAVIAPNHRSAEVLRSYGYKGSVTIIENATDMEIPSPEKEAEYKAHALSLLNLSEKTRPVFLFVGQHSDKKNIPLIIESLRILKDKGIDFQMVFVGDGEDRKKYEKMIAEYGLQDNVIFYGITRNREDIAAFYSLADLFLFPSLYDVSCLVKREAAAHSVPCMFVESVTSEGVEDRFNGFIAKPDAVSYAKYIEEILSDDELRKTVGENARRTLYRNFSDAVKEIDELYRKLIAD